MEFDSKSKNVSFRASAHTGVGISIEFQAAHRHTVCSNLPFPGIHSRKVVRLSGGLPHQESGLVRNDREFDKFHFVYLLNKSDMHIAKHNDCRF